MMNFSLSRLLPNSLPLKGFRLPGSPLAWNFAAVVMVSLGCGDGADGVRQYQAPRAVAPTAAEQGPIGEPVDRMIGAVVPGEGQTWYFKLSGPKDVVAEQMEPFVKLVRSLKFEKKDGPPQWTLPEGWTQEAGEGMRFATIHVPAAGDRLEMSVIPLPQNTDDQLADLTANINRWRGQMGLGPVDPAQVIGKDEQSETLKIDLENGPSVTLVNLLGRMNAGGMGKAPFAGGGPFSGGPMSGRPSTVGSKKGAGSALPPDHPPVSKSGGPVGPVGSGSPAVGGATELTYAAPEGWAPGRVGGLRKAAFNIDAGGKKAEMTVIDLAEAASALLPNVNRWREQMQQGATSEAQLKTDALPVTVDGAEGHLVFIPGPETQAPRQAILGAVVVRGGLGWFFKMTGDHDLVAAERERFELFLKSVKFNR